MIPLLERKKWERYSCSEYAAPAGHPLPKVGVSHCSEQSRSPGNQGRCPPRGKRAPSLLILAYQNGPSPWLCAFLQTLGHHGVPATILGWEPLGGTKRIRKDYYFADKIYSMLHFLSSCPLPDSTLVLFCDTDELMQVTKDELERSLHDALDNAQDYCFPAGLYQNISEGAKLMGWVAGTGAGTSLRASATAVFDTPICLNSGNYFGRPRAMIDLLNRTCVPCRKGLRVDEFHRLFHGSYTTLVPRSWFFDDQIEMAKLYVAGFEDSQSIAPLTIGLDSRQRLFLPLSEWTVDSITRPPKKVQVQSSGLFHSRASGAAPAFVHFNGPAKAWVGAHSASTLMKTLTRRYVEKTGDSKLRAIRDHVRNRVTFLNPDFERVAGVGLDEVCSAGTSLQSAYATSSLKKLRTQAHAGQIHGWKPGVPQAASLPGDGTILDAELNVG